ncbi:MAG: carbohydrate-binding family 9-like protein [Proteobacteria bacterium]|nr:carbohydrate-binding family 9-like protein [Pseudomonadota bacterium]MBU1456483.1 carbohydrate-binding family 9-like protein [Pseudomonadota bacterium]
MFCKVVRLVSPPQGDACWDKSPWKDIPSQLIQYYMGSKPDHFPKVEVKITYDDMVIYLMFRVADRYVRAVAAEHQDNVWEDSCVEFFFTPDSDVSKGYFNIEMNCGGTMLFHFQPGAGQDRVVIPKSECEKIRCAHSLPRIVDPEIEESVTWTVEYWIPTTLLKKYCQVVMPAPEVVWRANFYKCADKTSHPHWLTWSPVTFAKPNFHLPQFFGILEFD